jgi:hypothetical protein
MVNIFSGYLALIAGFAATWYVIFTYYLMKTTIDFNQRLINPSANISWEVITEEPALKVEGRTCAGKRAPDINIGGTSPASSEPRWVSLVITNARAKAMGKVGFRIRIQGGSETLTVNPFEVKFGPRPLRIELDHPVRIGIVDLMEFESNVALEITLLDFIYLATDSIEELRELQGEKTFSVHGLGMIVPGNMPGN